MRKTCRVALPVVCIASACALGHPAYEFATTFFWNEPLGGLFHDPTNWIPEGVPTGSDHAIFNLGNRYAVQFGANAGVDDLRLQQGEVRFALAGNSLTVFNTGFTTPGIIVGEVDGDDARLTIENGHVSGVNIGIGDDNAGATGLVRVVGRQTTFEAAVHLIVANSGQGTLNVCAGAEVSSECGVIAWEPNSIGQATVTGPGSAWVTRDLFVGRRGDAVLICSNGATVSTTRIVDIAAQAGSDGLIVIAGPGSKLIHEPEPANAEFVVGKVGHGVLGVLDSGIIEASLITVETTGTIYGNSLVKADIMNSGCVIPGGVSAAGVLTIGGNFTQLQSGSLPIELGGLIAGDEHDRLSITGAVALAGTLELLLINGFLPAPGQSFTILTADSIIGSFDEVVGSADLEVIYEANAVIIVVALVTPSDLDIKPGSCPNLLDSDIDEAIDRRGDDDDSMDDDDLLPVALVGTKDFDVTAVDLASILLSRADGAGGTVAPLATFLKDVATPFDGELCDCHELEGDGITDLSMKFKTDDVAKALELTDVPGGTELEFLVMGALLDGTPFTASDCIVIGEDDDDSDDDSDDDR